MRTTKYGYKPTTYALQIIGDRINKNKVQVDKEEFKKLLNREMIQKKRKESKGYVAIEYKGRITGCGLYKDELVSTRIPKGRSKELRKAV